MTKQIKKGLPPAATASGNPAHVNSPRLLAHELPGFIPITDVAGIVAVLNRDALLDALAKAILANHTTESLPHEIAELPNSESA